LTFSIPRRYQHFFFYVRLQYTCAPEAFGLI
jgi:hypothetical protein